MSKHQEHIICIKASHVAHNENGIVDYTLKLSDLMIGQRKEMENDMLFRQVLPISIFTCAGKVWAYERTNKGGEDRLHNKIAVSVGGHWDLSDLILNDGIIDLEKSLTVAMQRELDEEISLKANIIKSTKLRSMICADDTEVDRVHIAIIWVHELDSELISPVEDKLKSIGFVSPEDLLTDQYNCETWTRIISEILLKE
jgi:predicted NUDIX family phosphoesterase